MTDGTPDLASAADPMDLNDLVPELRRIAKLHREKNRYITTSWRMLQAADEIDRLRAALAQGEGSTAATEPAEHRAAIEVTWSPSASIGELDHVRLLVDRACDRLMGGLLASGVVDPHIGVDFAADLPADTPEPPQDAPGGVCSCCGTELRQMLDPTTEVYVWACGPCGRIMEFPADPLGDDSDDALWRDIESEIHQHMGHDGRDDATNDWVHDMVTALWPHVTRALAEARSHGEVLARTTTIPSGYAKRMPDGSIDMDQGGMTSHIRLYHVPCPPGTDVLVVRQEETQ